MSTRTRSRRSKASTTRRRPKSRSAHASILERRESEFDAKRVELGVSDDLREIDGVTTPMLVALGEDGMKTMEDFAGCAADDLIGWTERKNGETSRSPGRAGNFEVSRADAEQMVLPARLKAGWITEADLAGPEEEPAMTRNRRRRKPRPRSEASRWIGRTQRSARRIGSTRTRLPADGTKRRAG